MTMPNNTYTNRRAMLFDDFEEAERAEKLTTTEILETGFATGVSTNTNLVSAQVASATQVRLLGYSWSVLDSGDDARLQVVASTTSFASILDRDFQSGAGAKERSGEGWQNPWLTHEMGADGSIHLRAVPRGASVGSLQATMKAQTQRREPPDEL